MSNTSLPTILVLFGASGDLSAKKILPSLFHLYLEKKIPSLFQLVGFSRRPWNDADFRRFVHTAITASAGYRAEDEPTLNAFLHQIVFEQGDFNDPDHYDALAKRLGRVDTEWRVCANKLFHLAVPPTYLEHIVRNLSTSGLTKACGPEEGWTRVLVEKPFGHDLQTAERLDNLLGKLFREEQIYRIDHYLAKEMLRNIVAFRFSNTLFERMWSNEFIELIELYFHETEGVENRGAFYDGVGALRDVGQNHLLQMLALATMDQPSRLGPAEIRQARAQLLGNLQRLTKNEIELQTSRAQYSGYRDLNGVQKESITETWFRIQAKITSERWQGVPIVIEAGKKMPEKKKQIVVTFKHTSPCLCPPGQPHHRNQIIFNLDPVEGIIIKFWSKHPGFEFTTEERTLNFLLRDQHQGKRVVGEYEKLLADAFHGDQTLFNSTEEIKAMWGFIDPIITAWQKNPAALFIYPPETWPTDGYRAEPTTTASLTNKKMGIIGLGKMGLNLALRLTELGWKVTGYNRSSEPTLAAARHGVTPAFSFEELAASLPRPRVIWLMVPSGAAIDTILFGADGLIQHLEAGDIVIDGGNSHYQDDPNRAKKLAKRKIRFMDVGVSGGPEGARRGACLMIGGARRDYYQLEPLFRDIAGAAGYAFFPGNGAGHFVKMVHNGIEYGMMQALAEGFAVLKKSSYAFDLKKIADVYNKGSVIESRLVGWLAQGLAHYGQELKNISGTVGHTGEGEWTIQAAKKLKTPTPVIEASFKFRLASKKKPSYTGKILSLLRNQFGGHTAGNQKKKQD